MLRIIAALLAATSCVATGQAQETGTAPPSAPRLYTLEQAVAAAGGTAPATDVARADIEAARAARTVAGLRPNPEFQSQVENVAGSGPYKGFGQTETTVGLAVPIERGGKRSARIAMADARANFAALGAAIAAADVRLQVTALYIDTLAAERRVVVAEDLLGVAIDALGVAVARVRSGRASPLEEQRAEVARLNAEADAQRMRLLARALRNNLSLRVGRPISDPLDALVLDRLPPPGYGPPAGDGAGGTLTLAAADAGLVIADASVRLARSQRVPDVTVGPAFRRFSATHDTAAVVSLSIPIPLFNAGNAALAQASAERARAQAQRRMTALDIEQAITDAQAEADNAAAAARNASGPALAAAREAARIARIGYREGKFGQLELLDAERTLGTTRIAAIDALAACQNAGARLERLRAVAPAEGN